MERYHDKSEKEIEEELIQELGWSPNRVSQERSNAIRLGMRFVNYLQQDEWHLKPTVARRPRRHVRQPTNPPVRPLQDVLKEITSRYGKVVPIPQGLGYFTMELDMHLILITTNGDAAIVKVLPVEEWPTKVDPSTLP